MQTSIYLFDSAFFSTVIENAYAVINKKTSVQKPSLAGVLVLFIINYE